MKRKLVLGGPGAGKTKHLLDRIEEDIEQGVDPSRIALVSFTNAAADEARARACSRFNLESKDLPYFRTLHSLAFRELGLKRNEVIDEGHLAAIGELTGELFTGDSSTEQPAAGRNADPLLTLDHYARTTMTSLHQAWEDHGGSIEWFRLKRFTEAYRIFKEDEALVDFTDMLSMYLTNAPGAVPVEKAYVDESQDLTKLQHACVEKAFEETEQIMWAGDDDQSIHRWAGAAEGHLSRLGAELTVLPLSHRLPRAVFDLSQEIVRRIDHRVPKDQRTEKEGGSIEWIASPSEVNLGEGKWLLMARTRYQLGELAAVAREQGVVYSMKGRSSVNRDHVRAIVAHEALRAGKRVEGLEVGFALAAAGVVRDVEEAVTYTARELNYDASPIWHDALIRMAMDDREYYLSCLRRGEKLTAEPRIRIETIHGAKGAEADKVLLVTELTDRVRRGYELDPDAEHRVFYVGVTRTLDSLYLVAPRGPFRYAM